MTLTNLAILLLFVNAAVLSFSIVQQVLNWNLFPEHIELFFLAVIASFQVLVVAFYCSAFLQELAGINSSLRQLIKNTSDQ